LCQGALATRAARKKAIVAVARQLAVDLWRIRTGPSQRPRVGINQLIVSSRGTKKGEKPPKQTPNPTPLWNVRRARYLT